MNRIWSRAFFMNVLICAVLLGGCASAKGRITNRDRMNAVKKVAVLPFSCNMRATCPEISDTLATQLLGTRYSVIERAQFNRLLEEQGLSMTGLLEDQKSMAGKIKGVDAIIIGNANISRGLSGELIRTNDYAVTTCTARLVDVATGEILFAVTFSADIASKFLGAYGPSSVGEELAKKLLEL